MLTGTGASFLGRKHGEGTLTEPAHACDPGIPKAVVVAKISTMRLRPGLTLW